jgi:hypothetical protein
LPHSNSNSKRTKGGLPHSKRTKGVQGVNGEERAHTHIHTLQVVVRKAAAMFQILRAVFFEKVRRQAHSA